MARPVFLIGVDTEADDQWTLEGRKRLSIRNVERLPRLQTLCDRFEVRPSYLVTHEIATKPESAAVLKSLRDTGRCELGAHLHPWSSPPYREEDLSGTFPSQLPDDLLERQMRELTTAVEINLGVRPLSYRAGRYGLDGRNLRELEALGYVVDSSVDPLCDATRIGGPRFLRAPVEPYHPDPENVSQPGTSSVLEIPISAATFPFLPKWLEAKYGLLSPRMRGSLKRLGLRPVWLRPSYSTAVDAIALADAFVSFGVPTLNMMFHSSELLPNGSPYHRNEAAVVQFLDALERIIEYIVGKLNAIPMTYSEYAASRSSSSRRWCAETSVRRGPGHRDGRRGMIST